jgi:hypothetical protein
LYIEALNPTDAGSKIEDWRPLGININCRQGMRIRMHSETEAKLPIPTGCKMRVSNQKYLEFIISRTAIF